MKKYLLLLVFACTASLIMAQAIEAEPELVTNYEQGSFSADDMVGQSLVTNTAVTEKTFTWLIEEICNEAEIDIFLCNKDGCQLVGIVEGEITLEAGETSFMDLHYATDGIVYPLKASITLTEVGNDFNTVTITYEYGSCNLVLGAEEIAAAKSIALFPNPATDEFTLSENTVVEDVVVYNILGSVVKRFQATGNNTYHIADLNTGIYLVQLLGEDDEILRTMKMNKAN